MAIKPDVTMIKTGLVGFLCLKPKRGINTIDIHKPNKL